MLWRLLILIGYYFSYNERIVPKQEYSLIPFSIDCWLDWFVTDLLGNSKDRFFATRFISTVVDSIYVELYWNKDSVYQRCTIKVHKSAKSWTRSFVVLCLTLTLDTLYIIIISVWNIWYKYRMFGWKTYTNVLKSQLYWHWQSPYLKLLCTFIMYLMLIMVVLLALICKKKKY